MGFIQERHGLSIVDNIPKDKCQVCGTKHEDHSPHNKQSLIYQYKFYDQNGRCPTWEDAMTHCTKTVKELWKKELKSRG